MLTSFRNSLLNPQFALSDYGPGPFTATGFVAARWKLDGAGSGISVAPGTTSTNGFIPKWLRGRPCLDVTVDAATYDPATNTRTIRQRVEEGSRHAEATGILTAYAFGPAGGSFDMGFGGCYQTVKTRGNSASGTPLHSRGELKEVIFAQTQDYLTVEAFKAPAAVSGTYKIVFVQLEYAHNMQSDPLPSELRSRGIERLLCARYVWPCPRGFQAVTLSGGTQIAVPMFTPVAMTAAPSVIAGASPVDWKQLSTGTNFSSSTPTFTGSTTHDRGGRIAIGGFSALPASGAMGQIDADRAFVLEAELG